MPSGFVRFTYIRRNWHQPLLAVRKETLLPAPLHFTDWNIFFVVVFIEDEQGTKPVKALGVGVGAFASGWVPHKHELSCLARHR